MKFYEDKIYIKMCEKAIEIQTSWQPTNGDFSFESTFGDVSISILRGEKKEHYVYNDIFNDDYGLFVPYNNTIWLPRQDQLQEMVKGDFIETCDYVCHFAEKFVELKTPEKILLKIVMEELYHKIWNGEDWIEIH